MVCIALLFSCFLAACSVEGEKKEDSGSQDGDKVRIGMTFDTFILERWIRDRDVFVSMAQKLGAVVDVQNANGDVSKQKKHIQQFMEEGVDVMW